MIEDCFAYGSPYECRILELRRCRGAACPFYKTKEKLRSERSNATKRLDSLSLEKQAYIVDKYGRVKIDF